MNDTIVKTAGFNLTVREAYDRIVSISHDLDDLDAHRITPRSVVGTGYKNGRLVARSWLINQMRIMAENIQAADPDETPTALSFFPTDVSIRSAAKVVYGPDHEITRTVIERYSNK